MIKKRRAQLSFGDSLIADEVKDLREDWMEHADEALGDEMMAALVYEALAKRCPGSRRCGRPATPAEVVLRLLILKHVRNGSYFALERKGQCGISQLHPVGAAKMPDAKTMGRCGRAARAASE